MPWISYTGRINDLNILHRADQCLGYPTQGRSLCLGHPHRADQYALDISHRADQCLGYPTQGRSMSWISHTGQINVLESHTGQINALDIPHRVDILHRVNHVLFLCDFEKDLNASKQSRTRALYAVNPCIILLLIDFANSVHPDQNVEPDLDNTLMALAFPR